MTRINVETATTTEMHAQTWQGQAGWPHDRPDIRYGISPDALSAAGSYITRTYAGVYRVTDIATPYPSVTVFHVTASDGSRFAVASDRWGNVRTLPDDIGGRIDAVREMHANAVQP